MILGLSGLINLSGIFGFSDGLNSTFGGFAAIAARIGTGFLGWAALRAHVLSHPLAWALIIIGLVTIPIFLATPLPIGSDWATDFLAFLMSGIGYTVVGTSMQSTRKRANGTAASAAPQLAVRAHLQGTAALGATKMGNPMKYPGEKALLLSDGGTLCPTEYSDPLGMPVLLFHSTPGSRLA